jgi:hypothetical protein
MGTPLRTLPDGAFAWNALPHPVKIARLCAECVACGFAIQESPPVLAGGFFVRMSGYILGLDHAGVWADAKKGNHWTRRMGCHGSVGNGAGRARAASTETPTARPYGRYQEDSERRL